MLAGRPRASSNTPTIRIAAEALPSTPQRSAPAPEKSAARRAELPRKARRTPHAAATPNATPPSRGTGIAWILRGPGTSSTPIATATLRTRGVRATLSRAATTNATANTDHGNRIDACTPPLNWDHSCTELWARAPLLVSQKQPGSKPGRPASEGNALDGPTAKRPAAESGVKSPKRDGVRRWLRTAAQRRSLRQIGRNGGDHRISNDQ